ncbi:uncharacterized protein Zmynd8 isoform X3 [Panulirus ornatus]|uniref:uncharacterized protein Zmynd8 isoform X3 n=1 Tax=Panulirus ornatus TaxID=150431 RepID=UPI003A8C774A
MLHEEGTKGLNSRYHFKCSKMSELKLSQEDDSTPLNQDTVAEEDDNLSDMESHTGSERDAVSEAGSETPSISDKSSLRNSRSASNTPTNTRSTRSRDNPEFAAKQKSFMAKVQAATAGIDTGMMRPDTPGKRKRDSSASSTQGSTKKRKSGKADNNGQDYQNDNYCWECHREGVFICCEMCPRVFHLKCAGMEKEPEEDWACSECHAVMQAENIENRSRSMQLISVDQLCTLLKFALNRLKTMPGMEPFTKPVDTAEFPTYEDIVVHPVDFTSLERNIKRKFYGSTEAFSSDARWIVHNSVIFNGANSKVSSMARTLVKILKQEMSEIETCPDCYMNAHQNPKSWFTEACRSAHPLIWARLKGFPFWPAKAVKWKDGNVDVRFFGRHDRCACGHCVSMLTVKESVCSQEQDTMKEKNQGHDIQCITQHRGFEHVCLSEDVLEVAYCAYKQYPRVDDGNESWVPIKECFLFSEQMPTPLKNRNKTLESCLQEVNEHIAKLRERFGKFKYAPHRVQFNPLDPEQIKVMLPNYKGPTPLRIRSQSRALSRLSGHSDDETSSVASTDSGASVRRRKRESGTSSATQGTETETEIPSRASALGDDDKMEDDNSVTKLEEAEEEEDHLDSKSVKEINREIKVVRNKDSDEEVGDAKLTLELCNKTDDHESEEELEDCGKYPGENYEDDENSDDEDDSSSLMNGKSSDVRTVNEQSDDDDQHHDAVEYPLSREQFSVCNEKSGFVDEIESREQSEDEGSNREGDREHKGEDEVEEEEEELGNLVLSTEGEEAHDDEDISNEHESASEKKDSEQVKTDSAEVTKNWLKNDVSNPLSIKSHENESDRAVSRESQVDSESDSEKFKNIIFDMNTVRLPSSIFNMREICEQSNGGSERQKETSISIEDNQRTNDYDIGKGDDEKKITIKSGEHIGTENEFKRTRSEVDDNEFEDETNKIKLLKNMESDSDSDREDSDIRKRSSGLKIDLDKSDGESEKIDENYEDDSKHKDRNESYVEGNEPGVKKEYISEGVYEAEESDSEKIRTGALSDIEKLRENEFDRERNEEKIIMKESESDEEDEHMDEESKAQEVSSTKEHEEEEKTERKVFSKEVDRKSNRDIEENSQDGDKEDSTKSSLFDAVQLMKTMGTIAITRLDGKSLDHDSGNDRVTISVAKDHQKSEEGDEDRKNESEESNRTSPSSHRPSPVPKVPESKEMEQHISSLGCSVSVTKAVEKERDRDKEKEKDKEKVKMPSGVDTTRLSPSISIIPMSGGSDRHRSKTTVAPSSSPSSSLSSPTVSSQNAPRSSPSVSAQNPPQSSPSSTAQGAPPRVSSSSSSSSPQAVSGSNIPPPPPLSHPQSAPGSNINSRGVFGPPPPGSQVMGVGSTRGPIMTTPGMRMMSGGGPGMMGPSRMPGGPPTRHLPPEAGPLAAQLHKHSQKLAEVMRATLEDVLGGLVMTGTPEARVAALQLELERTNWRHQQELAEVRHNADVMLVEMRANLEAEKQRAVDEVKRQMEQQMLEARRQMERQMVERLAEVRRQMEAEKQRAVEETKKKQWCANCGKEALFFCCWNTSYCDYPCQQSHWPQHMSVCGQNSDGGGGGDGGPDSVNGEASAHSSRVSTPVQNLVAAQDDVGSLTSSILAQCLIKGNRDRPRKKARSSTKSSGSSKEKDSAANASPKAPKSPKAWMEWFLEQSGAEGIKENLHVTPKTSKSKARKSSKVTDGSRKKRKSTPCVRRKIEHILKPEEVTKEMLDRVATKPKEKMHDQENGTSCHQCRQKTSDTKTICRSGKCVGLRGFFCGPCLRTRYGEDARKALLDPNWCCPVCRGICNCSLCRKAFGQQAVGQIVQRLGKMGYSNVQQYLDSKSNKEDGMEITDKTGPDKGSGVKEEEEEESQDNDDTKDDKVEYRYVDENDEESLIDT